MKMKSKKIYVRVSDERYEFLVNKSKEHGITVSALINILLTDYINKL